MCKINEVITQTKVLYASNNQDSDRPIPEIENMNLRLNISDSLFFETLLLQIRGETISYESHIKRQQVNRQENLEKEIVEIKIVIF